MKIVITSSGQNLDSQIDLRFGRALGFIIAGHQMHHLKIIKEKYL